MVPAREPESGMLLKNAVEKSLLSRTKISLGNQTYQVLSMFEVIFFSGSKGEVFSRKKTCKVTEK